MYGILIELPKSQLINERRTARMNELGDGTQETRRRFCVAWRASRDRGGGRSIA